MKKFALLTDRQEDIADYSSLAENIRTAFNAKFLTIDGFYNNNTVTANILPLCFGMVPEDQEETVFQHITDKIIIENNGHISTGLIGTQWLMRGLSKYGRADIAYKLATNRDYPGWGYMVENGATTIWELWNGNTANPEMNSHNHVMLLGDLVAWFYENLAGIKSDPESPGFREIIMKPEFIDGLDYVKASYHSIYGPVKSEWKKGGNRLEWVVVIPPNTTAEVHIPASSVKDILESGLPVLKVRDIKFIRKESDHVVLEIGSGSYNFTVNTLQQNPD